MSMRCLLVQPGASYSTADVYRGYKAALQAQGHEIISYNLDGRIDAAGGYLMSNWRRHGKAKGLERPSSADILYLAGQGILERALRFDVEWVVIVSGMYLLSQLMTLLRRAGKQVAVLFTESPYDDDPQAEVAGLIDLCWTNERASVRVLAQRNANTYYLPHAYDPARHRPDLLIPDGTPAHDVVFVGSGFIERIRALEAVDWTGIDLGLYGSWSLLGSRSRLRQYIRGGIIDNGRAAALYRNAKIGLNLYRTSKGFGRDAPQIEYAESLNPRALELAACGCFSISNYRAEVAEVFGEFVPTFRICDQLEKLVRRWLADDAGRLKASVMLPRLIAGHTYEARGRKMVDDLRGINQYSQADNALARTHASFKPVYRSVYR